MFALPPKMHVLAVVLAALVATTACTCVAAAGANKPLLVENLPASVEAKDYIRARCNGTDDIRGRPDLITESACYDLLLPYAASINGSHNRASLAIATVMVSKFADLQRDLRKYGDEASRLEGCVKVLHHAIAGAKEALPALSRLCAIANDKEDMNDPDLVPISNWLSFTFENMHKCWDGGLKSIMDRVPSSSVAEKSQHAAAFILYRPNPNWTLPSPDGSKR